MKGLREDPGISPDPPIPPQAPIAPNAPIYNAPVFAPQPQEPRHDNLKEFAEAQKKIALRFKIWLLIIVAAFAALFGVSF